MTIHCKNITKKRIKMTLNDNFRYQGHGQPLLVSGRWVRGEGANGSNNNSGSSKNANNYLGAGVTPDNNQFLHYKRTDDHIETFRNNTHLHSGMKQAQYSPVYFHPNTIHYSNIETHPKTYKKSPLCTIKSSPGKKYYEKHECHNTPINDFQDPYKYEGPFVFGVHSPSHFQPNRYENDDSYDYADVVDERSVIDNSESENLFCDKSNSITIKPCIQNGNSDTKRSMHTIDDKRTKSKKGKKRTKKRVKAKIKCVFVGDGAVGKTSLITSYAQNVFSNEYTPTTFDKYDVVVEVDGSPVSLQLCDTAGQESLKELRELCYPGTDVIILCFSIIRPESFKSIIDHWIPAVDGIRAPFILVGTHGDLRECPITVHDLKMQGTSPILESKARNLAERLNAPYIETSSKTRSRLKEAFDSAILAALPAVAKKKSIWKKLFCIS